MNDSQIYLDHLEIEVIRKSIKNAYIKIFPPDGKVRITAPKHLSDAMIRDLARQKLPWIQERRAKLQHIWEKQSELNQCQMISGEIHYFLGKAYTLQVIEQCHSNHIALDQDSLNLYIKPHNNLQARLDLLTQWYRQQLHTVITPLIAQWLPIVGVEIQEWRIKKMKTRWGSCNITARRIWFNLELVKQPIHCIEYVVVHELVHLLEKYHNARFYNILDEIMTNWRSCEKELQQRTNSIWLWLYSQTN